MKYLPLLLVIALFVVLMLSAQRNRRRQAAEQSSRAERLAVGTQVMTTSGLYGTVVARNDDGTVQLAIAPGIEVKWALAALRDADSLTGPYRQGMGGASRAIDLSKHADEGPNTAG